MIPRRGFGVLWAFVACLWLFPALASADSSVVVLGVRSLDGDDKLAHEISVALRAAASKMPGWNVSQRDVSLAQMSLAHGCEEPDARCMADIASTLEVDRLIYGTALKVGDEVQLSLFNFDAVTGQVESSLEHKSQSAELAEPAIEATMASLVRRLSGERVNGMLRVNGDTPNATVLLDGKPAGTLDLRGELLITEVAAGTHVLVVESESARRELSVEVAEAQTAQVRVSLRAPSAPSTPVVADSSSPAEQGRSIRKILGYSTIGLGGALLVATVVTWVRIDGINGEPDLKAYRNEFPAPDQKGGTSDVCAEAENGTLAMKNAGNAEKARLEKSALDLCNKADTLEVLQYVFLGGAVAAGAVGTYLVLTAPDEPRKVSFRPRLGQGHASLSASIRF